jgi:enediyne biosynthesis protein E3
VSRYALAKRLRTTLFDLERDAARLDVRGFARTEPWKQARLESSGTAFIDGYRAAIRTGDAREASRTCEETPLPLRGFAFEGAAMGLSLLDLVTSMRPRRFTTLLETYADSHAYMVHVGAGWAIARCPWGAATFLPRLDPVWRWLTVDGIGFHAGFFHRAALYDRQRCPVLRRCEPEAFDAGLGRALWFACGAQSDLAVRCVTAFDETRRAAIWSGVGLAVAYAGGADAEDLAALARDAGAHRPHVALGAAFAAKARQRAGNPAEHTDQACRVFCGLSASGAADLTDQCREGLAIARDTFPQWRERLLRMLALSAASRVVVGPGSTGLAAPGGT